MEGVFMLSEFCVGLLSLGLLSCSVNGLNLESIDSEVSAINVVNTQSSFNSKVTNEMKFEVGDNLYNLMVDNYDPFNKTFIFDFNETEIVNQLMVAYKESLENYDWIILTDYPYEYKGVTERDQGQEDIMRMFVNRLRVVDAKAMYGLQMYNVPIKSKNYVGLTWSNNSRLVPYGNRIGICITDSQFRTIVHELGHNIAEQALMYEEPDSDDTLSNWVNNYWEGIAEAYVENNGVLFNIDGREKLLDNINIEKYKVDLKEFRNNLKTNNMAYSVFMELNYGVHKMPIINSDYLNEIFVDTNKVIFKVHGVNLENITIKLNENIISGFSIDESSFDSDVNCKVFEFYLVSGENKVCVLTGNEKIQEFSIYMI